MWEKGLKIKEAQQAAPVRRNNDWTYLSFLCIWNDVYPIRKSNGWSEIAFLRREKWWRRRDFEAIQTFLSFQRARKTNHAWHLKAILLYNQLPNPPSNRHGCWEINVLKRPWQDPMMMRLPFCTDAVVLCVFNFSTMSIFSSTCTDVYLKNSKLDWLHVESGFLKKGSLPSKPRNDPGMRWEFRLIKLIQSEFIKMTTMTRNFYQCGVIRGHSGVIPG